MRTHFIFNLSPVDLPTGGVPKVHIEINTKLEGTRRTRRKVGVLELMDHEWQDLLLVLLCGADKLQHMMGVSIASSGIEVELTNEIVSESWEDKFDQWMGIIKPRKALNEENNMKIDPSLEKERQKMEPLFTPESDTNDEEENESE